MNNEQNRGDADDRPAAAGGWQGLRAKLPAFARLARLDKPVGIYLLLWPTWSALFVAAGGFPDFKLWVIFGLGVVLMRSAGCCVNDFADAHIDGAVERTRTRVLVTGELTRREALAAFALLAALAFALVLLTDWLTVQFAVAGVALASLYPFTKRFLPLPQGVLGIAYSWGILMAFTAQAGALPPVAWLLFLANVLWTVAYDTQYAMVDREHDLKIGVQSAAILFGNFDRLAIALLQAGFLLLLWLAGSMAELGLWHSLGLGLAALLCLYQQFLINSQRPVFCFQAFLSNQWVGAAIFAGIVLSYM